MLKFTKMHGLGNDYIFIYDKDENLSNLNELSKKLSNRNLSVGSDGIIIISKSKIADFKMRIFNADGSEAKMCGNGIRCVAKYLYDNKLITSKIIKIETLSGIKEVKLILNKNKNVAKIGVNMGKAKIIDIKNIKLNDTIYKGYIVDVGNPHIVLFTSKNTMSEIIKYGKRISSTILFNEEINVEFVRVLNNNLIEMSVYERGTGITYACGTGSSAAYFAAYKNELVKNMGNVKLKYGTLNIKVDKNDIVYMTGNAITSYEGIINTNYIS